ncbi:MAG: Arginase [uncultured Solirubrobacteraceae bacterium]|uniref:Arginase n=1 Tax=uncultured Solirubrobacteraceae bacterium TaxID=1162706 RepID=A0A6J4RXC6_9ACTN|nr:MAG: Arginase [uncultured Solirubrobacteraceae bacterium]
MDRPVSLIGLLCRTSDRKPGGGRGVEALAPVLAEQLGVDARFIGSTSEPRDQHWRQDLVDSRGCLLEAGGQIDDALVAERFPILLAGDCSIAVTTLPTVARHVPEAHVLWLDAHGDFNTPDTTGSDFLGGMCLAAACGRWDAGLTEDRVDPSQVVMCGARDLDDEERVLLEAAGVRNVRPSQLADMLDGEDVYVHLDLDVLDPTVLPAQFPADGGLSDGGLRTLLGEVAGVSRVIGLEITAFQAPELQADRAALAETISSIIAPLLPGVSA